MSRIFLFLLLLVFAGCAGSEPAPASGALAEADDEPGATRASRERAGEVTVTDERPGPGATGSETPAPTVDPPPDAPRELLTLRPVDVAEAEDGRGGTVPATDPIAFDLDARRFPARAADPVLQVGALRFHQYVHPRPGVLRFVVADRRALPADVEVAVQYGDDAATRVVVTERLELP